MLPISSVGHGGQPANRDLRGATIKGTKELLPTEPGWPTTVDCKIRITLLLGTSKLVQELLCPIRHLALQVMLCVKSYRQ